MTQPVVGTRHNPVSLNAHNTVSLIDSVSVTDFGAVGDGSADDTTAIQNALDAVNAGGSDEGKPLYFPYGIYRITSGLTYNQTAGGTVVNLVMRGAGGYEWQESIANARGTIIYLDTATTGVTMLSVGVASAGTILHSGPIIEHINFYGNGGTSPSSGSRCLYLNGVNRHAVQNCGFRNMETGVYLDDDNSGNDCDWGMYFHNVFNNVKHCYYTNVGMHIVGGALHADATIETENISSYSQSSQTVTITLSADFSNGTTVGDAVLVENATDSNLNGPYTIQAKTGADIDVFIESGVTLSASTTVGTVKSLNSAVRCDSANVKINNARIGGANLVGVHNRGGPIQVIGNGFEGPDCCILQDGADTGDAGDDSSIIGNIFDPSAANYNIVLGPYGRANSIIGNGHVGGTVVDRSTASLSHHNYIQDAEFSKAVKYGFYEQSVDPSADDVPFLYMNTIGGDDEIRVRFPDGTAKQIAGQYDDLGQVTLSSGTATVTFTNGQPNTSYRILLSGNANETFYWSGKGNGAFTINSSNASSTATVDWFIKRA